MDSLALKEPNITIQSFAQYVRESRVSIIHKDNLDSAFEFLAVSNALGGEAGELQNIVKKIIKHGVFYSDHGLHGEFVLEAGDVLHYLISLIQLGGYNLETVMAANVQKLDARKQAQLEAQETTVLSKTSSQS